MIADGGFENGGIPSTIWNNPQTSTNFGTPLCDNASCGTGGGAAPPRTGLIWAWFGGVAAPETATLGQDVTIPAGIASLHFWMRVGEVSSPFTDVFNVRIDNNVVQSYTEPATPESDYTERVIDVSMFAGGVHNLTFEYIGATSDVSSFVVDDVSLIAGACMTPSPSATPTFTATATATSTATATATNTPTSTPTGSPTPLATYRNPTPICTTLGSSGSPYPSTITVAGGPNQIGGMRVNFLSFWHVFPDNFDALLVGPGGQKYVMMGDAGGAIPIDEANPVTLMFADFQPVVLPDSGPLTSGTFDPTTWETPVTDFAAPAPAGPYVEPGSNPTRPINQTMFGTFGFTNSNGDWKLYTRDDGGTFNQTALSGCLDGGWELQFLPFTAAGASISGRVMTANGQGIRNAQVVVTGNTLAHPITISTGSFGWYTVDSLQAGETYVVTINSQRYTFSTPSRVISLVDNVTNADFIADPQ